MAKIAVLFAMFFAASFTAPSRADTPLPPPKYKEIWSPNKAYSAVMAPKSMTTTVIGQNPHENGSGMREAVLWSMKGWFRVAHLADDGEHLVCGHDGMNFLPLNVTKDEPMIRFYNKGKLQKTVTLGELLKDMSSLKRTASHYVWGGYAGIDAKGRYVVKTVEGKTLAFDVATGKPIARSNGKADENAEPEENAVKQLTKADDGKTVKIAVGKTFDVVLRGNPTTGYQWELKAIEGDGVVQNGKAEYAGDRHPDGMVGVGGAYTFHFDVKKPAKTKIRLVYRRSWEKKVEPAETFEVTIDSK